MASKPGTATGSVYFTEVQQLRQWWLWAIILTAGGFFGAAIASGQEQLGGVILGAGIWIGITTLLVLASLRVTVDEAGIHIRQLWLFKRDIPFDRIASFEARTYRPIREYLGWGVRYGPSGMAYNMSGNRGLQLILTDGSRVLIGSQRPEDLERAVAIARERHG